MKYEEFQTLTRGTLMEARRRFRDQAMPLCRTDADRAQAHAFETAIGDVSSEEAMLAFMRWLAHDAAAAGPEA
jgi:hypothetical protein